MIEKLVLSYLRSNAKDLRKFWEIAWDLGVVYADVSQYAKLALVSLEWCIKHGTPTPDNVEAVLRRRKLL